MKTLRLISVSILFAALGIIFTACNQSLTAGQGTGTVRIVIDNGASRAVNAEGMPVFDGSNTTITVTDEGGTELKKASGATPITLTLDIGKKINIKVVVTTEAGEWRGTKEHTVTAGTNTVAVKLSKAPKDVSNLLFSITGTHTSGSNIVSLSMKNGKKLLDGILINNSAKPLTARDSIGRLYLFYQDRFSVRHFKRFDVEGKEDTSFPGAALLTAVLHCTDIAVDTKTDTLFLVARTSLGWKIYYTNKENSFVPLLPDSIARIDSAVSDIHAVAAYNGIVYLAVTKTGSEPLHVMACKADLSGPVLALTKMDTKPLQKLRTAPSFGNNSTKCIGLFADEDGVYCLLKEQELRNGKMYAQGQLVHYTYSGSALTEKTKVGLNPVASTENAIAFNARYFSNPIGFIGSDEENIYIADDGANIEYLNENWRVSGNKNRIAAFNRKEGNLTFSDTNATWYAEFEYKKPNTKILLWETGSNGGMNYWISETGKEKFSDVSEANQLFEADSSNKPTDVFCYDQDGNLYILWEDNNTDYNVSRFVFKADDGTYYTPSSDNLTLPSGSKVSAIAADCSAGEHYYLYYADTQNNTIKRFKWGHEGHYALALAEADSAYTITLSSGKVTALAANKDGVFVSVTETYKDGSIDKYRLKVQKYKKADGGHDSEITLVDNAVSYTNTADPPIPIPAPSLDLNHEPNMPCNQYQETINGLQIGNGKLYGISSKLHRKWKLYIGRYFTDVFKHSSKLYEIGDTKEALPNEPLVTKEKPAGAGIGYGFYRFIAVKYDEQERIKCIIASDSAWGDGVSSMNGDNSDRIVEFNLKDMVFGEDKESGGTFSKTLTSSGFFWN
jgi:putative lipoprotein